MPSVFGRLLLFLSSYFPLALILFFLLVSRQPLLATVILLVDALGLFLGLPLYLRALGRVAPVQVRVDDVRRRDGDAVGYIGAYAIPFVALPLDDWGRGVALCIFFVVLAVLYVRSNTIYVNPVLNLAGYHLYEVSVDGGGVQSLIARRRVAHGDTLRAARVDADILWEQRT